MPKNSHLHRIHIYSEKFAVPMRPDTLHELIHSLSPNERRYFKLHALPGGGQPDSNFMQLFEALRAQSVYDEAALKQAFAQRPLAQHLSSEKNYLYRLILRSLRAMNEEGDHRAQTRAQIENAILLFERGLYAQSQKALRRARKLAAETEHHIYLLEIFVLERRLWKILHDKGRQEIADALIQSQIKSLDKLRRIYDYYDLYDRMFLLTHQKFSLREQRNHPDLRAILDDPLLHDITQADSFEARQFYWQCQAWRHQLLGDHLALYNAFKESVAWWEAHPTILKTEAARYVVTLSNLLHAAGLLERYDEFPAVFAKIRHASQTHVHGDIQVLQTLHYYELLYAMNKADWPAALASAQVTVAFLKSAGARVAAGRRLAFAYNLSILYFLHADYKAALHWVNDIIDTSGSEMREDIQHFARILLIIIHFELAHWDILEYLHRSSYRYLFTHKQLMPYEQSLMDALNKLMQNPEETAQKTILHALRDDLERMLDANQAAPGIQELYCWLDSKTTGRPMKVVMAARLGAH
jgi:hypothetical protein